jgi:hypothetical protein
MISSKDRAAAAIKDIQARAKGESGLKLKALCTDCGGEFTVMKFTDYCLRPKAYLDGSGVRRWTPLCMC